MMEHVDDHHIVILLKQMFLFLVCVAPKCCPLAYRQVGMGGSSSGGVIKDLIDGAASLQKVQETHRVIFIRNLAFGKSHGHDYYGSAIKRY